MEDPNKRKVATVGGNGMLHSMIIASVVADSRRPPVRTFEEVQEVARIEGMSEELSEAVRSSPAAVRAAYGAPPLRPKGTGQAERLRRQRERADAKREAKAARLAKRVEPVVERMQETGITVDLPDPS